MFDKTRPETNSGKTERGTPKLVRKGAAPSSALGASPLGNGEARGVKKQLEGAVTAVRNVLSC